MSTRPTGRRTVGHGPRRARVRRASPRLAPVRAAAALVLLVAAAALYGAMSSSAFALRQLEVEGVEYASRAEVVKLLALASSGENLIDVRAEDLEERLVGLPTVTDATITIALPDTIRVRIVEREPILVWTWDGHRYLVDRDGLIFADASASGATPATRAAAGRLPIVEDRRIEPGMGVGQGGTDPGASPSAEESPHPDESPTAKESVEPSESPPEGSEESPTGEESPSPDGSLAAASRAPAALPGASAMPTQPRARPVALGASIDPILFDAATRIASLTPAQVGSTADRLVVILDDIDGFLVETDPIGWQAVFGFYSASIRSPELIPGQVRSLRSLLVGREDKIRRVVLADDRNGTYTVR